LKNKTIIRKKEIFKTNMIFPYYILKEYFSSEKGKNNATYSMKNTNFRNDAGIKDAQRHEKMKK